MGIVVSMKPLVGRVRGRLGQDNSYQRHAGRQWTLCPASETVVPPAVFDERDLQRVVGVSADDTIEGQFARARGGRAAHEATVAYELADAVMLEGNLYTDKVVHPVKGGLLGTAFAKPMERIDSAALASSQYGVRYFGHWIADDLLTRLAAGEIDQPVTVTDNIWPTRADYLRLLSLESRDVSNAVFKKIVVFRDVGQNDYKRARYEHLYRVGQKVRGSAGVHPGVLLLRGKTGAPRLLTNEAELVEMARRRGFVVVDPETTSAGEMMRVCSDARVVMGIEGSHLFNGILWMSRQGALVVIQPPHRFVMVTKDLCDCIGIRMAFIVGHPVNQAGFRVDLAALERLCDRIDA